MIELKGLVRKYGSFTAVNNIDLLVPKGEIFGFIGPNGAGKTTTIKMMGGIIAPTSGSVNICGIDMGKYPEKAKQKIGYIPDRPFLYEKLTGMEFLKFVNDLYQCSGQDFLSRSRSQLEMFSLLEWGDELIESYSHGMKQRLIMAAALLHDPELLVVDEPMVGLDPRGIRMVKEMFKRLAVQGITIFMSTHTLKVAQDVCNSMGIINKGKLIARGSLEELQIQAKTKQGDLEDIFLRLTQTIE